MLTTVVELAEFVRKAKAAMTDAERKELIDFLAANPEAGVSLGGGLRKLRFAREGGGKSGGFRSVHYYQAGRGLPVFLLTVFAKNDKANLTAVEEAALATAIERIVATYRGKT
jgi:hypothetical protein